jgi:regulator of RNase E activity RraA
MAENAFRHKLCLLPTLRVMPSLPPLELSLLSHAVTPQVHECWGMGPVAGHICTVKGLSAQNWQAKAAALGLVKHDSCSPRAQWQKRASAGC